MHASENVDKPLLVYTWVTMTSEAPPLLDLQNICVMRGEKVALDDFSLRIAADEHIAILGPNGCGKSTLIKTITRECYPVAQENSSMTILGQERWDVFDLRTLLGIVSNDLMLSCTGDASGRDVVLSGFFSSIRVFPHHTGRSATSGTGRRRAGAVESFASGRPAGL